MAGHRPGSDRQAVPTNHAPPGHTWAGKSSTRTMVVPVETLSKSQNESNTSEDFLLSMINTIATMLAWTGGKINILPGH